MMRRVKMQNCTALACSLSTTTTIVVDGDRGDRQALSPANSGESAILTREVLFLKLKRHLTPGGASSGAGIWILC